MERVHILTEEYAPSFWFGFRLSLRPPQQLLKNIPQLLTALKKAILIPPDYDEEKTIIILPFAMLDPAGHMNDEKS
ncbi:hypothetical protein ACFPYJ_16235 [Paenibacillus solisilvae]|uniref:Uncharacterized protein n=1 Tax=Paenibacillus solisilvae TaxID=2486751 RepID=A0ABW0W0Z5_9BACL